MRSIMHKGPPQGHGTGSGDFDDDRFDRDRRYYAESGIDDDEQASMEENLRNRSTWKRFLFMIVMAILFSLGVTIGCFIVLLQFLWVLFTGHTKKEFSSVGRQLAEYCKEIVLYMTFNTEQRPFPFDRDWPSV
jgi:hypothetical protein